MEFFKINQDIEESTYYLDATHPHIPNWSKYTSSFDFSTNQYLTIEEFLDNTINNIILKYNLVKKPIIHTNSNCIKFNFEKLNNSEDEFKKFTVKITYLKKN